MVNLCTKFEVPRSLYSFTCSKDWKGIYKTRCLGSYGSPTVIGNDAVRWTRRLSISFPYPHLIARLRYIEVFVENRLFYLPHITSVWCPCWG